MATLAPVPLQACDFGSFACGEGSESSGIDIAVLMPEVEYTVRIGRKAAAVTGRCDARDCGDAPGR